MASNILKTIGKLLAAALFLVGSSNAWSAYEKLLDPAYYRGTPFYTPKEPRIDMTNISLSYNKDWNHFTGFSKSSSTFTLYNPSLVPKTFTGFFALGAHITSNGTFNSGNFGFFSNDPYFGFKNSYGNWGNVFSGTLTALGASSSKDAIEFGTAGFSGWACDKGWCTQSERLWFTNVDGFPDWKKNWSDKNVNGTAVIPVPAAVWLLGSGLLGMVGVARRKKA